MMGHIKRLLGFTHRVKPVTMEDVAPAPMDPVIERRVRASAAGLATDIMRLERSSYEIRQALAYRTLMLVGNGNQGQQHDQE